MSVPVKINHLGRVELFAYCWFAIPENLRWGIGLKGCPSLVEPYLWGAIYFPIAAVVGGSQYHFIPCFCIKISCGNNCWIE